MDKIRMNQILEILLAPYTDLYFESKSGFESLLVSYRQVSGESITARIGNGHNRRVDEYNKAYKEMMDYFKESLSQPPRNMDDIYLLFEHFFPIENVSRCGHEKYLMENIMRIADSLLTFRDGEIAIRTWKNSDADIFGAERAFNKVEVWNNLIRILAPDILIAAFAIKGNYTMDALYCQGSQICMADKLLAKIMQKGMAETHMHLNAGYEFQEIWESKMDISLWQTELSKSDVRKYNKRKRYMLLAAILRMDMAMFLVYFRKQEGGYGKFEIDNEYDDMIRQIRQSALKCEECEFTSDSYRNLIRCVPRLGIYDKTCYEEDYLFRNLYLKYRDLNCGSEMIFLYQCIEYCNNSDDEYFLRVFFQYVRLKNMIYRYGVERNEIGGLKHFQDYFQETKNIAKEMTDDNSFLMTMVLRRHMSMHYLKKLEVRIAPGELKPGRGALEYSYIESDLKKVLLRQICKILTLYRKMILEMTLTRGLAEQYLKEENIKGQKWTLSQIKNAYSISHTELPVLGIVFHFLKKDSIDNMIGHFCWHETGDDLIKTSGHRIVQRKRMGNLSQAIEELRHEIPKLNEYIVGIDAASDENASEPWNMLPAYTAIRNRRVSKPILYDKANDRFHKVNNIGFTYHVGEDFRHPLSGLRHVDEVIEHFRYRSGDRLGHAIVLGMNMDRWVMNNEVVVVKAGEELENYLWLWGKMVYDQWRVPIQIEALERNICKSAEAIYDVTGRHNMGNITIDMLYKAYRLKFNEDHEEIFVKYQKGQDESVFCKGGICKHNPVVSDREYQIKWNHEKLLCTQYCPVFEKRFNESVLVTVHENDAGVLNYIQDKLLGIVEVKGIFVEVNPTSNLAIGEVTCLADHPIFRMNRITGGTDAHNVMVTINSDDPSVFATNIANEFAYIYHALKQEGYKEEDILIWIDKVRNYGLEGSFIKETKKVDTIFDEVTDILVSIEAKLRRGKD